MTISVVEIGCCAGRLLLLRSQIQSELLQLLGHRDINTTLLYTQLVSFERDDYYSAVAKTTKEARGLIDTGFEYVCTTPQDVMLFRKRK